MMSIEPTQQSKSYNTNTTLKNLVNSEKGDVIFLVGSEKKRVNAYKAVLASVSPAFDAMFFGNLKEGSVVEVPDMTYEGFHNMIKLIHGYEIIQLNPSELLETFIVVDKYVIDSLRNDLCTYFGTRSIAASVYDQMIQLRHLASPIEELATCVQSHCEFIFKNGLQIELSEEAMEAILKLKRLDVLEIDVLKAISTWIVAHLDSGGLTPDRVNKQRAFEPFKRLIRFTDLSLDELKEQKIDDLLTHEEARTMDIEYESGREKGVVECVYFNKITEMTPNPIGVLKGYLKVDEKVFIRSIRTIIGANVGEEGFTLTIYETRKGVTNYKKVTNGPMEKFLVDDHWEIQFPSFFQFKEKVWYAFVFDFNPNPLTQELYKSIPNENGSTLFYLEHRQQNRRKIKFRLYIKQKHAYHCIKEISFHFAE